MLSHFCLTIRFLQPYSHGRGDGGEPEWPPSPLRAFQALTAAAAATWNERTRLDHAAPALAWLERRSPPIIIAPVGIPTDVKYRLYVPDNVGDKVAKSWSGGREGSIADYRTEKDVRPVTLLGEAVHYLWALPEATGRQELGEHLATLRAAARSITHLGWGVDMVAGDARIVSDEEAAQLPGERWLPAADGASLRTPVAGTLAALIRKHEQFLDRLSDDGFRPVAPLTTFRAVGYRRATDVAPPPVAAFQLLKLDGSGYRSFDTMRKTMTVAGMLRHAAMDERIWRALGFTSEDAADFLHGHGETRGAAHVAVACPRLAYLPLPSIEFRGGERGWTVGNIRRALITVVGGAAESLFQQTTRLLSAAELKSEDEGQAVALLSRLPTTDKMVGRYTKAAAVWSTVTPVVLPGHDDPRGYRRRLRGTATAGATALASTEQRALLDKLDHRIEHLLRKAIRQAGFSDELSRHAQLSWRSGGFRSGTATATNYSFPNQLRRYRRVHVRIAWRDAAGNSLAVPGPICLGAGRYCGLGLFAADEN